MVLEAVVSDAELRKHPLVMLFLSALFSSIGLWVSYLSFPNSSSILGIAFVTIALVPTMHSIFVREETIEAESKSWTPNFLERHFTVVKIYAWFFIGLILSYAFWYAVLPQDIRRTVFDEQEKTIAGIEKIKSQMTGKVTVTQSACGKKMGCWFNLIFYNNSFVLALAILFSFIYGAGAVFLIGWNASVIGVVIGKDALNTMLAHGNIVQAIAESVYRGVGLLPHGLPESMGYFFGAIAGGIIGVAVSRENIVGREFRLVAKDALITMVIAFLLLFAGAVIESWLIVQAL